jgi:hypothetical protein
VNSRKPTCPRRLLQRLVRPVCCTMTMPRGSDPCMMSSQTQRALRLLPSQEYNSPATTRRSRLSGAVPIRDPCYTPNQRLPATHAGQVPAARPRPLSLPRCYGVAPPPRRQPPVQLRPRLNRLEQIRNGYGSRTWADLRPDEIGDGACCTPLTRRMALSLKYERQEATRHRCRSNLSRLPRGYPHR